MELVVPGCYILYLTWSLYVSGFWSFSLFLVGSVILASLVVIPDEGRNDGCLAGCAGGIRCYSRRIDFVLDNDW